MRAGRAASVILFLSVIVGLAVAQTSEERSGEDSPSVDRSPERRTGKAGAARSDLSDLIAATPDGATLRLSGEYSVSAVVEITDRRMLTIEGDGTAVVRQLDPEGEGNKVFLVTGGSDITLRDFEIAGANSEAGNVEGAYRARTALGSAIAVKGTQGIRIEGMDIHDTWGDFVDLDKGPATSPATTDVVISGNTFQRNGRQGVSMSRLVSDVRIEGNLVTDVRRSVFDIEHAQVVSGIEIADNRIDNYRRSLLFVGRGGEVSDLSITGNTVTGSVPTGKRNPTLVEILARDSANPVRGVRVCANDVTSSMDVLELSGATEVTRGC